MIFMTELTNSERLPILAWAEAAIREAKEEINVDIRLIRPLGIFDSRRWHTRTKAHMYHVMFLAEIIKGEPSFSHEVTELGWFKEDALPKLHYSLVETMPILFKQLKNDKAVPYFDGLI
jgi:ADP-ribose pyrophosphatase YjhB (NUDIX family)